MAKTFKFVVAGAIIGLLVATALGTFAFTEQGRSGDNVTLFLLLCPPPIAAMHDRSISSAIVIWILICFVNAGLYAGGALIVRAILPKISN